MRLARDRAGGCTPGEPLSYLRQERVRDRTGQAAFLPTARAGAWPHRTSRPLACGKGGGLHPRRAAFLPTARAESTILQLGGNTRTRAEDLHRPSVSERPQARSKVLCQAFFQETAVPEVSGKAGSSPVALYTARQRSSARWRYSSRITG